MDNQKTTEPKATKRPAEKRDDSNSNNGGEVPYCKKSTSKSWDHAPSNSKKK